MSYDFSPESQSLSIQTPIFLNLGIIQRIFVLSEGSLIETCYFFLEYFIDKSRNVLLQFISILDIALDKYGKSKHSSMIILKTHDYVAQLFLGTQIIEGWFFDKSIGQLLDYLGPDDSCLVLVVHYQ